MNIGSLARGIGISSKVLIKKANLINIYPSGPKDQLSTDEMILLRRIGKWSNSEITKFNEGLEEKDATTKLKLIEKSGRRFNNNEIDQQIMKGSLKKDLASINNSSKINKDTKNKFEKILARITELNDLMEDQEEKLDFNLELISGLDHELQDLKKSVLQLENAAIENLEMKEKHQELKRSIDEIIKYHKRNEDHDSKLIEDLENSVRKLINEENHNGPKLPRSRNAKKIQNSFLELNLAYSDDLLNKIILGLDYKCLVVEGQPGIGKTSLLKNINLFFSEDDKDFNLFYYSVLPDWDSYDILGGKKLIKHKLFPQLGILCESIVECIKTGKTTFLILDEFNRAKPDDLFSGIMDWLNDSENKILFKELKLIDNIYDNIYVPENFRIICGMNNEDHYYLHSMSEQMRRRLHFVKFDKVDIANEQIILKRKIEVIRKELTKKHQDKWSNTCVTIVDLVEGIRGLELIQELDRSLIGTSYVLELLSKVRKLIEHGHLFELDDLVSEHFSPKLKRLNPAIKEKIISEVYSPLSFRQSSRSLQII